MKNFYQMCLETGIVEQLVKKGYMTDSHTISGKGFQQLVKGLKNSKEPPAEDLTWVENYRKLFSKDSCGIPGKMDDLYSVKAKMQRFIMQFNYSEEIIMKAATQYVKEHRNSPYITGAGYLIFKATENRSEERSLLAGLCEEMTMTNNELPKGFSRDA